MRRISLTTSIVPALVAGTLVCAPSAGAAPPPPMAVSVQTASGAIASYFDLTAQSDQVVPAGTLKLRNPTEQAVTVLLDPVGGLTASTLGSAYGPRGRKARGAASWLVLGQRRVVLAPHGKTRVPIEVRMGSGVRPGDYLAGIGVQAAGSANEVQLRGNVAISNVQRYAIGVVVRVPGARHPLIRLPNVKLSRKPAGVTFSILGRNSGNVILQNVKGAATITSGDHVVARRTLGPGTFVSRTSIAYPIVVPSLHPKVGAAYRVRAYLRYPGGVAHIDKVVSFGEIDAMRQEAYGGPKVNSGNGGNHLLLLILLVAAAVAGCLAALGVRRHRSGERALRRALPREIAHARASGEPLSATMVLADPRRSSRELGSEVSTCLRRTDRLFRLKGSSLMVVSPDTTPKAGETLAAEIRRHLARDEAGAPAVIAVTNAAERSAEQLLHAAAAPRDVTGTRDVAGNGAAPEIRVRRTAQNEMRDSGTEAAAVGTSDGPHS